MKHVKRDCSEGHAGGRPVDATSCRCCRTAGDCRFARVCCRQCSIHTCCIAATATAILLHLLVSRAWVPYRVAPSATPPSRVRTPCILPHCTPAVHAWAGGSACHCQAPCMPLPSSSRSSPFLCRHSPPALAWRSIPAMLSSLSTASTSPSGSRRLFRGMSWARV